ncbi:NAD(P)/FAD-dependent oxidoreductase [Agromyces sp. Marseille-P2726]|uniref:NAD(P)/FAD-dependent oxidoreductase n=1 Tax=Agromyces sp. Marseille-P2726 TaxID=2709132 RepID=UPI0020C477FD|nr:FAD-dependent oxidoreductase [Agromyces sp. Marseille-P2726]
MGAAEQGRDERVVIIGGGLAGAKAAEHLREAGFTGSVRIVAGEAHSPYIRPPLSKEYLNRSAGRESVFVHEPRWYDEHGIVVSQGVRATTIDPAAHTAELDSGETVHWDRLLLATGASSRRLRIPGADAEGVLYLRTLEDSERLHDQIADGTKRVVIVGSGWIGLEVAAAARGYGNEVTVLGLEQVPLETVLGAQLGDVFGAAHRERGVRFRLPAGVSSFEVRDGRVTGVVSEDETLPADVVVVGIGAAPNTALAEAAGLEIDNGIVTDASLRTSVADIYAAGDVANAFHPVLGRHLRNEHWANALNGGRVAGRVLAGQDAVFDDVPYFYTDQYDIGMEYAGYPPLTADARVVVRGDLSTREFIAFWQADDGRVVAGMNVNIWDVSDDIQALIRSERPVDPQRLADPEVPITELADAADPARTT